MIGVLPESVVLPPSGQGANATRISGDPQRVSGTESGVVSGASLPPIGVGVDYRPTADKLVIGVGEIVDPFDHRRGTQTIASGPICVNCPILVFGGSKDIRSLHSISRTPGRVIPSRVQPPPLEANQLAWATPEEW